MPATSLVRNRPEPGIGSFRSVHLWLLLALIATLMGFTPGYFLRFGQASWLQHLHGMTAMAWMALVVVQPWLATRGHLTWHRRIGRVALVLAGMVIGSALAVLPGNIAKAVAPPTDPFVPPAFFYGITFLDLVIVTGFGVAVIMAMLNIRRPREHALWMVSTVFWVLSPGLARLVAFGLMFTLGLEGLTLIQIVVAIAFPILALLVFLMVYLRQAHPALVLAFIGNCSAFMVRPIGDSESWRRLSEALFLAQ